MLQQFIVFLLFVMAMGYVFHLFYKEFTRKEGCGGCASCGGANTLKKINQQVKKQNQKLLQE